MKKILFSLLTAAFTISFINAQQQSYYPNMVGSPTQSFVLAQDTSPDITDLPLNLAAVGASLTWNFTGLDADSYDTIFFDTRTAQEIIDFPSANLVMEANTFGRIVFDKNAGTGLFLHGTALDFQGIPLALNYNPPQQWLPAVASLGSSASTVSTVDERIFVGIDTNVFGCQITIDSIQLKRISDYTVNFDATGSLQLPLDTFAYTIRGISKEITVDSVFIFCPTGISGGTCLFTAPVGWSLAPDLLIQLSGFASSAVVVDSSFTASWYYPYTISPVCVVDFTYDSAYTDTNFITTRFKGTNTPDIGFEQVEQIPLSLYPNPATNMLMLQTSVNIGEATMYIFNAQGQQVKVVGLNGTNTVDVSGLSNGMYFYQLADEKKLMHQGKFIIKR